MTAAPDRARSLSRIGVWIIAALCGLEILWELRLAPLHPGGSWLVLKALPLAIVVLMLVRNARVRTVAALVLLPYFVEGVVRGATEHGRSMWVALCAAALAVLAFGALYLADRAR